MALRAYCYLHNGKRETEAKKRGDVISVHLSTEALPRNNSPTHRQFIIIENWEDTALEREMRENGETKRAYPYATYEDDDKNKEMLNRSTRYVDTSLISLELRNRLLNLNEAVDPIEFDTLRLTVRTRN